MAFRKYDTYFFERYAALCLSTMLGHKFDGLVNRDRPDLQSQDGKTLGIEVTRAMSGGKGGAQLLLKEMAGVHPVDREDELELYFSGVGMVKFDFSGRSDIVQIGRMISKYVLK